MANKKDLAFALAGDKNLSLADLRGADLRGADLRGAHLLGANLTDANLYTADLTGAGLTGAKLIGANLRGADLTDASLAFAELDGANLRFANLTRANLEGAFLDGAFFNFAKLDGAVLTDTILDAKPRKRTARKNPSSMKTTAQVVSRATRRILADIKNNVLPYDIESFSELHDYVDANVYLLDDRGDKDATMATLRTAVKELDLWLHERAAVIRARMPRSNPVTMTRQRVTELRAEPTIDAATERLILDTARAMVRRGGLINRGMNEVVMLDGRPWTIQTDRIGDVIYAVLKHGRQSHYLVLSHPKH